MPVECTPQFDCEDDAASCRSRHSATSKIRIKKPPPPPHAKGQAEQQTSGSLQKEANFSAKVEGPFLSSWTIMQSGRSRGSVLSQLGSAGRVGARLSLGNREGLGVHRFEI